MSSSPQSENSSSSSYSDQNSSKIELRDNGDSFLWISERKGKLEQLFKKGKMLKFKYTEKKEETLDLRKKFIEDKAKKKKKKSKWKWWSI